ncbi:MAG: DUF4340 domain-containing protein [Candidatus Falkowbacteria bacterium]
MNKKNLILGGILIILIAVAYLWQGPVQNWQESRKKPKNFLAGLNAEQISIMEISGKDNSVVLEKTGDRWKIAGTKDFYVSSNIAAELFSELNKAIKSDVLIVGEKKENQSKFETGESGVKVILKQGETALSEFIVGKQAGDFISSYLSLPDSDKTYMVKADLNGVFARDDWYDKTIFAANKDAINKIRFQYPGREFTIEKASSTNAAVHGQWSGSSPNRFSVNQEKAGKILDIMSNLSAAKIPAQTFDNTGLEKNSIIVEATGDNVKNTIMIGDASADDKDLYYAKRGDSDNIYLITKEERDELEKQTWQLR